MLGVLRCLIATTVFVVGFGLTVFAQGVGFKAATSSNGNGTTINQAIPSHSAGDLLILNLTVKGNVNISSITTGWISLTTEVTQENSNTFIYYKFTTGGEPNVVIQTTVALNWAVQVLSYSNATTPNLTVFSQASGTGQNPASTTIMTGVDSARLLVLFGFGTTGGNTNFSVVNPPTGMTLRSSEIRNANGNNKVGVYAVDQLIVDAADVGSRSITNSVTSSAWSAIAIEIRPISSAPPAPSDEILYSYQSGNWNAPLSWTRDPSGTTLIPEDGILPVTGDSVVILNGRIITATADITTEGLGIRINGGGTLNLATFQFTNTLRAFSGTGRMRSSRTTGGITYMPMVTGGQNRFILQSGGTMEYYCASNVELNTNVSSYFNLELSRTVSGTVTYTQASNLTIYNNLVLSRTGSASPTFTVGNNTTARTLTINGSLQVAAGTNFRVGTANALHNISIGADLINNGSVRFLNITSPNYLSEPTDGRAIVTFNGLSDNKIDCFGETNFYRLILDKGSDATYILTVNSSNVNNFRLLGINNQSNNPAQNPAQANPTITKALVLNHGTLRLKENLFIR